MKNRQKVLDLIANIELANENMIVSTREKDEYNAGYAEAKADVIGYLVHQVKRIIEEQEDEF